MTRRPPRSTLFPSTPLSRSRPAPRTSRNFEGLELRVGHSTAGMRADGFKHVLNRNGVVLEAAGGNRAAVENESGDIQSRQGHDATRNGLVAANEDDERIEEVAPGDQLDRVRDDFA